MLNNTRHRFATLPTPIAGLALGIASLGWCWENSGLFDGRTQTLGAAIAAVLLLLLTAKFVLHPRLLAQDLSHPVVGSVVPTFAMAAMVVSASLHGNVRNALWLLASGMHIIFLLTFMFHRLREFRLHHMVPSWFVPPVGMIVAAVANPGGALEPVAQGLMWFGLSCYALMLPFMLYRLMFCSAVPDAAKPTIAILAAPASLSLAGYLTVTDEPNLLLVAVLLGVAMLMTSLIYLALFHLLRLPFSPAYAAFTFPLVISATALFKVATLTSGMDEPGAFAQLRHLAQLELIVATLMVGYVTLRYLLHLTPLGRLLTPDRQATQ
ncbi:TDT family transporter [Oceanimonas baumannii]|uniref:C4-dicarboxylate ABC transporter n=1 Tax=Oceanimonas baumannii TaxID=129578 RepID=A0A235CFY8_9GAMM|nr:TDT family transporter [Oceanimonas baumannii]OYD22755.1 C4-dicarboxylate ABC transporter [Oceanimonas baumannii]TDW57720.1 tellurite resistance protein TehA-like permease [Oceanimonas baumannii]